MENDTFYQMSMSSTGSLNNIDISYVYSDFVSEVALHVRELRDSIAVGDIQRYQPIVANMFSCVKSLLGFTDTIGRDSKVLKTYPELARSRQTMLRALGNLYAKCRVANGSQSPTTTRQRQLAVEKLVLLGNRVLRGISDFTSCATEIGLRIMAEAALGGGMAGSPGSGGVGGPMDMAFIASNDPEFALYGRPRRRVSRANSAKGFKSFNAVRQWRSEHLQKHATAKKAVELLLTEYMECLDGGTTHSDLGSILRTTLQCGQAVEMLLASAEEMRVRTNIREEEEVVAQKFQLSLSLTEVFEYIQTLETDEESMLRPFEEILNRLMTLAFVLLKHLTDLEPNSKVRQQQQQQQQQQEQDSARKKRISFAQDKLLPEEKSPPPTVLKARTLAMTSTRADPLNSNSIIIDAIAIAPDAIVPTMSASSSTTSLAPQEVPTAEIAAGFDSLYEEPRSMRIGASSRNTAPAVARHGPPPQEESFPVNRKFASLNSLSDSYRRQVMGQNYSLEVADQQVLNQDAKYGEAHDLEKNLQEQYRIGHDSAVVISSGGVSPHGELKNSFTKESVQGLAILEEVSESGTGTVVDGAVEVKAVEQTGERDRTLLELDGAIKAAERQITESFFAVSPISFEPLSSLDKASTASEVTAEALPPKPNVRTSDPSATETAVASTGTSRADRVPRPGALSRPSVSTARTTNRGNTTEVASIGLGVSIPASARARTATAAASQRSGSIPRPSGVGRARSPVQPSPRLESSRRMGKTSGLSPQLPSSPRMAGTDTKTLPFKTTINGGGPLDGRNNNSMTNLSPAGMPSSRRGSENSIRSESSGRLPRKSSESASHHSIEPLSLTSVRPLNLSVQREQGGGVAASLTAQRRLSKSNNIANALRSELFASDDEIFAGLTTPTTPNIRNFMEIGGNLSNNTGNSGTNARKPVRNQRRESILSTLSVATDFAQPSSARRPLSPANRNRGPYHQEPRRSISLESSAQLIQPIKGGPTPYRPRPNRVGQSQSSPIVTTFGAKGRTSGEFKRPQQDSDANSTAWFLDNDYEPDEIMFHDNGNLMAATFETYIEILTSHKVVAPETAFVNTFFTTFRLFTTPTECVTHLVRRFVQRSPKGLTEHERLIWDQQKRDRVQKR